MKTYQTQIKTRSMQDVQTLLARVGFPVSMSHAVVNKEAVGSFFKEAHQLTFGVVSYTEVRDYQGRWSARAILSKNGDRVDLRGPDPNGDFTVHFFVDCWGANGRKSTMEKVDRIFEEELEYHYRSKGEWSLLDEDDDEGE